MNSHLQIVSQILVREFDGFESFPLLSETTTFEELGLDSLDVYTFISCIEEEYSIKITDDQLESIISLGSLINLLPDVS